MARYTIAPEAKQVELRGQTAHLKVGQNRDKLKSLLHPDLAADFALCYWSNDGCYYCSDDGTTWYVVTCIT